MLLHSSSSVGHLSCADISVQSCTCFRDLQCPNTGGAICGEALNSAHVFGVACHKLREEWTIPSSLPLGYVKHLAKVLCS
jgi:hypothetical protein